MNTQILLLGKCAFCFKETTSIFYMKQILRFLTLLIYPSFPGNSQLKFSLRKHYKNEIHSFVLFYLLTYPHARPNPKIVLVSPERGATDSYHKRVHFRIFNQLILTFPAIIGLPGGVIFRSLASLIFINSATFFNISI